MNSHSPEPVATRSEPLDTPDAEAAPKNRWQLPLIVGVGVLSLIGVGQLVFMHGTDDHGTALDSAPREVSTVSANAAQYHRQRRFVGTVEPWVSARIGPQLIAAYVKDVFVRPGAIVKANDLLATLDCRSASASSRAVAAQAEAIDQLQVAMSSQAKHMGNLVGTGYVSENEVVQHNAQSMAEAARGAAARAQLAGTAVAVSDCNLRAPFAGEIGGRFADPGAFASPGVRLLSLIDRNVVRVVVNVPETDFAAVAPQTAVRIRFLSTGREVDGQVTRRSPEADPMTRTVEVEVDLQNTDHTLPINTTAELWVDVSAPQDSTRIPLSAATVRGEKAKLFVVEQGKAKARTVAVVGEAEGELYLDRALAPGSVVVTEGRSGLHDGDTVTAHPVVARKATEPKGS